MTWIRIGAAHRENYIEYGDLKLASNVINEDGVRVITWDNRYGVELIQDRTKDGRTQHFEWRA